MVEAPTRWPSSSSSPCSRTYPQRGFSRATRNHQGWVSAVRIKEGGNDEPVPGVQPRIVEWV